MKKLFFVMTLLIGFSTLIISSCSKSNDPTPATTTSASPVAGSWQRSSGGATLAITFKADYTYSATAQGTAFESGTYSVASSAITLNTSAGSTSGCGGKTGKYNYVLTGTLLTFTLVSDSCSNRAQAIPGPWNKQ